MNCYTDLNLTDRENALALIKEAKGDLFTLLRWTNTISYTAHHHISTVKDAQLAARYRGIAAELLHLCAGALRYMPTIEVPKIYFDLAIENGY